jgi:hypothetical protein
LHLAVSANQFEMVNLLLKKGANVNARNAEGQHCSHLASLFGNEDILELLLSTVHSEGLDARDDDGMTPLHLASNAGDPDNDRIETPDKAATGQTHDKTSKSQPGRYDQVVQLLLQRGANTKAVTKDNKTALELALDSGHLDRWELILNSLGETSDEFSNALLRVASDSKRHATAIVLLQRQLKKSGTPWPKDPKSWTAIEWAAYTNNPDALWLLIASSSRSEETKKALDRAKNLVRPTHQVAKTAVETLNQKVEEADDIKKRGKGPVKEDLIRDIIENPPTGVIYSNRQEYGRPNFEGKFSSFLEIYEASIVQFYKKEAQFGSIIKSQSVKDTIYTEGPKKIMEDAASKLKRQAAKVAEWTVNKDSPALLFMDNEPKFTWVHLPATNVSFRLLKSQMADGLTDIMKMAWMNVGFFPVCYDLNSGTDRLSGLTAENHERPEKVC